MDKEYSVNADIPLICNADPSFLDHQYPHFEPAGELIGKLGAADHSTAFPAAATTVAAAINDSCYHCASNIDHTNMGTLGNAAPLATPPPPPQPQPQRPSFPGDHGFPARAAEFSCFGSFNGRATPLGLEKNLNKNLGPVCNFNEESPVFKLNCRKRKMVCAADGSNSPKGIVGAGAGAGAGADGANAKLLKPTNEKGSNDENDKRKPAQKPAEPPKDYIHVRARRGQATDSHSLAERVRREKISQRMKLLQDLVPGCNKVTGKALMLDEIINYVESLQRQVEFLSMKLATINPSPDINMENLLSKHMYQQTPHHMYPLCTSAAAMSNHHTDVSKGQLSPRAVDPPPLDAPLCHNLGAQLPSLSPFHAFGEDDLRSIVRMGFGQNIPVNSPVQNQNPNMKGDQAR